MTPPSRPLYLDTSPHQVFATLHEPGTGRVKETAVVICSPWGWDDVASYRSVRAWAIALADAGHPTLRFDYPATGESGGCPSDGGLVDAWIDSITSATSWMRALDGVGRVAVVGLGLGGLLAAVSAEHGAPVDDLLSWAAPARGSMFVRTEKAFSRLQASRYTIDDDPLPSGLPDGWMETGGFILSAESIAALKALELPSEGRGRIARVLILDQDGIAVDETVAERFRARGAEVTEAPGPGWGDMVAHPETTRPPDRVMARFEAWLSAPESDSAAIDPPSPRPSVPDVREATELALGLEIAREIPLDLDLDFGRVAATLCEPSADPRSETGLCMVFMNAGAVRRIGPNRLWVEVARRWAAQGLKSVRVDLEGIGDAEGDSARYSDIGEFYVPSLTDQTCTVLAALRARGIADEFIVVGLCSGSYWGFHAALRGAPIAAAVLLNPRVLFWEPVLDSHREARKIARVLRPAWIREVLRGRVSLARMRAVARAAAVQAWSVLRDRLRGLLGAHPASAISPPERLEEAFESLQSTGARTTFAFSGDEPLRDELERDGIVAQVERWPRISFAELPARDHTLRPIAAQRAAHELLDREIRGAIEDRTPRSPSHQ